MESAKRSIVGATCHETQTFLQKRGLLHTNLRRNEKNWLVNCFIRTVDGRRSAEIGQFLFALRRSVEIQKRSGDFQKHESEKQVIKGCSRNDLHPGVVTLVNKAPHFLSSEPEQVLLKATSKIRALQCKHRSNFRSFFIKHYVYEVFEIFAT